MRQKVILQLVMVLCLAASACFGASQRCCQSCGEWQEADNRFCIQCGTNMTQKAEVAPKPKLAKAKVIPEPKSSQFSVLWSASWAPIGLALVPEVGFPASSADIYGLDFGILETAHRNVIGAQLAGLGILAESQSLHGISMAGAVAVVDAGCGLLIGGVGTEVKRRFCGVQIGLMNKVKDGAVVQLGLINMAGKATCSQVGLFNMDYELSGTQYPLLRVHW